MSLQLIPLRWMIKECLLARTQIQFDLEYVKVSLNFDFEDLVWEMETNIAFEKDKGRVWMLMLLQLEKTSPGEDSLFQGIHQAFDRVFDPLASGFWWILEFIPFLTTRQDSQGNWIHKRM